MQYAPHTTPRTDCDKHIEQQTDTNTFSHVYKWSMDEYDKKWEIRIFMVRLNRFVVADRPLHDQIMPLTHLTHTHTHTPGQIRTVTFYTSCELKSTILHIYIKAFAHFTDSHTSRNKRLVVALGFYPFSLIHSCVDSILRLLAWGEYIESKCLIFFVCSKSHGGTAISVREIQRKLR